MARLARKRTGRRGRRRAFRRIARGRGARADSGLRTQGQGFCSLGEAALGLAGRWLGAGGLGIREFGVGGLGVGVEWVSSRHRGLSRAMVLLVAKSVGARIMDIILLRVASS